MNLVVIMTVCVLKKDSRVIFRSSRQLRASQLARGSYCSVWLAPSTVLQFSGCLSNLFLLRKSHKKRHQYTVSTMIPVDHTRTINSKMKNFAEHIDIDMDTSVEGSVDMSSSGEDSTREKRDNAKKSTSSSRRGRPADPGAIRRRKPPQRMKSRSFSPDKRKERPYLRSKSRSLSPDRIRKRTVDFDVDTTSARPTMTKVPSSRRVMRSSSGSRRKLLGDMLSSSARPPSTRRLMEKSPSRRKLINDLNDSSVSDRRRALGKTPSSRHLKENKSGNIEGLRRSLNDAEKPPSLRNLRKSQSFKLTKTPSSRRLKDNSSNSYHEQVPKLQKTPSRRNLLVENGKKPSTRKLKENVSFQDESPSEQNKLQKSSSRRNLMADKSSTTRKQPPSSSTRKTSRSRKSHSVDPQVRRTEKKMPPRTVSRSLSPEEKSRRNHRGTGMTKLRNSKSMNGSSLRTNEQRRSHNDATTTTTTRPRLKETMTQFDTTTEVAVGRKRHQQRRKTVTANLEALVQKHNDSVLQLDTESILEELENEPHQQQQQQHPPEEEPEEKKSSEWKKAKKVLTKMTKKIIGKQAELLFFNAPQDAYGAVGEGDPQEQQRRHSSSEDNNNNNPTLVTAS
jgi:hypothetical protein